MKKTFNEKRTAILEALAGNEELLGYAEEVLKKAKKGSGIKKDSVFQQFKALIIEKGEINEFEMYRRFKAGKHESLTLCRQLRTRVPEGEEPIWAQDVIGRAVNPFTNEEEDAIIFKVLGVGEDKPEDYVIRRQRKVKEEASEEASEETSGDDFEAELSEGLNIPIS